MQMKAYQNGEHAILARPMTNIDYHIAATVNAINIVKQHEAESEVQEDYKTLTQDVFKGAPPWANFLVVNAYGIGFFTDESPYLATWRAPNGWVQSSFSKSTA